MSNDGKNKEETTLATLMRYFNKSEEDKDENNEEENEQEEEYEQEEQIEQDDQENQEEEQNEQEDQEEEQGEQYREHSFGGSKKNMNHKDDEEGAEKQQSDDEDDYTKKRVIHQANSSSIENSYYNEDGNDSDSAKNINIKVQLNQPKAKVKANEEDEEEEEAFLKREEEKKHKADEEKRKSETDSVRYHNLDENKQNEIKTEMKKREETLKAKLKKSEEELRSELKKKEESGSLSQSKQSGEDENDYQADAKPSYQPSFPKEFNKQPPVKDQRPSIQLRSKEEELKKSKLLSDPQKTIFDKFNEEVLKDKYLINEKIFDELTKSDCINSKNINSLFHPALYNDTVQYTYQPEINDKSRKIVKEVNERNKSVDQSGPARSKSPIELTLYDDAVKRREKLNKVYLNSSMNIKLNASKTKISNNSHKIAINKIEKNIDEAVKKYEKGSQLSFLNVAQILTELKIFRELLPKNEEVKKPTDLKEKIAKVRERETRKIQEINFLEQIWFRLNPKGNEFLRSEIFGEFMKVLFSPVESSITEIASILKQFLQAALFLHTNKNNGDEHHGVISPLSDKEFREGDLWPLELFVRRFLELKENIIAYQPTGNKAKMFEKDLVQERKNFTFKPKIENNKMRLKIFEKKLPTFIEREKLRQLALQELKKEAEKAELDQCTFKPTINTKYQNNESFSRDKNRMPVYDKLYKMNKDIKRKQNHQIEEKEKEELQKEMSNCSFQPHIPRSNTSFDKKFSDVEKPKGYNKHIEHTRRGILENLRKKYLLEYNPSGENYEKMRIRNIQPFNITDMKKPPPERGSPPKTKQTLPKEEDKDGEGEDDYFTIQVKIPSGKERTVCIYPDDDPFEVATAFCQTYGIKDEVRNKLAANIQNFQQQYLLNQSHEGDNNSN